MPRGSKISPLRSGYGRYRSKMIRMVMKNRNAYSLELFLQQDVDEGEKVQMFSCQNVNGYLCFSSLLNFLFIAN